MRTTKELLELMLERQDKFSSGLCFWVSCMYCVDLLDSEEERTLHEYIKNNRPFWNRVFNDGRGYWWRRGNIKPRIKWIKKHIKKLSK